MYANDNIAFYLHKNRNFIDKLFNDKKSRDREEEAAKEHEEEKAFIEQLA